MLKDTLGNNLYSEIEGECNCEEPRRMDCAQGDWCKRCGEFIFNDRVFKESTRAIRSGEIEKNQDRLLSVSILLFCLFYVGMLFEFR